MTTTATRTDYALTAKAIEQLKEHGNYREAGQVAAKYGCLDAYGCHFGLRSTKAFAASEFHAGYREGLQAPEGIEVGVTGSDWEPRSHNRFYAQKGDGYFAFGATPAEALSALQDYIGQQAIKDARDEEVLAIHRLGDKFHRELGRVIGTDADADFWARHFGCTRELAAAAIEYLIGSNRARRVGQRLYAQ